MRPERPDLKASDHDVGEGSGMLVEFFAFPVHVKGFRLTVWTFELSELPGKLACRVHR